MVLYVKNNIKSINNDNIYVDITKSMLTLNKNDLKKVTTTNMTYKEVGVPINVNPEHRMPRTDVTNKGITFCRSSEMT